MNRRPNEILALRDEGRFYASYEERQRRLALSWGSCVNEETGVAVVSVNGPQGGESWYWGMGTYTALRARLESLMDDESVKNIVLEINSPGGDVNGLFECCNYIKSCDKPITAHVTGMCCSAAFAIAACCSEIYATETSEIGSVGVYAEAWNEEEWMKKNGILSKIFRSKNAEKKNQSVFTEEGAKDLQAKLDYYEDCFYTVLAEGRGMDKEKCIEAFGHGAVFLASDAVERNMINAVMSYDELIEKLASSETEEDEGDDMDFTTMTAEERASAFQALVQAEPSLLAEVEEKARTAERERINALNAERTQANAELIDKAIADGSTLSAIAMDLYKAEKTNSAKAAEEAAKLALIRTQAENTQTLAGLQNPMPDDMKAFDALCDGLNEKDDKEGK